MVINMRTYKYILWINILSEFVLSAKVIQNIKSKRCLDVSGGSTKSGANVELYECNNSPAQLWMWRDTTLISMASGKCLNVNGAYAGSNVHIWDCNGNRDQQWQYVAGTNQIQNIDTGLCIEPFNGAIWDQTNIQLADCSTDNAQQWHILRVIGNTLTNINSGKCLDVAWPNDKNGANVQLQECNGDATQQWRWSGNFLINVHSQKCLDTDGIETGSNIQLWDCAGNSHQQWTYLGDAKMILNPEANMCIGPTNAGTEDGTNVELSECSAEAAQNWAISSLIFSLRPTDYPTLSPTYNCQGTENKGMDCLSSETCCGLGKMSTSCIPTDSSNTCCTHELAAIECKVDETCCGSHGGLNSIAFCCPEGTSCCSELGIHGAGLCIPEKEKCCSDTSPWPQNWGCPSHYNCGNSMTRCVPNEFQVKCDPNVFPPQVCPHGMICDRNLECTEETCLCPSHPIPAPTTLSPTSSPTPPPTSYPTLFPTTLSPTYFPIAAPTIPPTYPPTRKTYSVVAKFQLTYSSFLKLSRMPYEREKISNATADFEGLRHEQVKVTQFYVSPLEQTLFATAVYNMDITYLGMNKNQAQTVVNQNAAILTRIVQRATLATVTVMESFKFVDSENTADDDNSDKLVSLIMLITVSVIGSLAIISLIVLLYNWPQKKRNERGRLSTLKMEMSKTSLLRDCEEASHQTAN